MIDKPTLIKLHKTQGWSYSRIGRKFGLGFGGVLHYIRKYNITSNYQEKLKANKIVRKKVLRLYKAGMKLDEIARATHTGRSTMDFWIKKSGLTRPRKGYTLSAETKLRMSKSRQGPDHPAWKGDALLRVCSECEKPYRKDHGRRDPKRGRGFCSPRCSRAHQIEERHPCWKGGSKGERGGRYEIWARKVVRRDVRTCQRCGSKKQIHAHHIRPWILFPTHRYDLKNGVALCKNCHLHVHSKKHAPSKEPRKWLVTA